MGKTFVGFGFGAIQAGLFVYEAERSGCFDRIIVAEVVPETVAAIHAASGCYRVNVATDFGIEMHEVRGVELLNSAVPEDRAALVKACSEADEIVTALPSVKFFDAGGPASVAAVLAESFRDRFARGMERQSVIYAAENDNHAAEKLEDLVTRLLGGAAAGMSGTIQFLNTVIGKMSGVVADESQIREQRLVRMAGDEGRCFLVESFNRILISRVRLPGFVRGIAVFEEKDDLLPFEEAKLYGHNATHALIGYLARRKGYEAIADVSRDERIPALAHEAFLEESGKALCRRHSGIDPLFTEAGYREYADDLLRRMMNPHLRDAVERVVRDPRRKLAWNDRLVGTMRIALGQGIVPVRYAQGARAAVDMLVGEEGGDVTATLDEIWSESDAPSAEKVAVLDLILERL